MSIAEHLGDCPGTVALALVAVLVLAGSAGNALAEEPIIIGLIDSYSGPQARPFADPARYSWNLVVEEFNAKGGLHGRKVKLLTCDDHYTPEGGVSCAEKLVQEGADFLAGSVMSDVARAVSQWARQHKKIFIAHVCATHLLTEDEGHRYCFHTQQNVAMIARSGARFAYYRKFKKWYILTEDNEFGHFISKFFFDELKKLIPDAVILKDTKFPRGTTDFSRLIEDVIATNPVALYVAVSPKGMVAFVRQAVKAGLFSKIQVIMPAMADPIFSHILKEDMPTHNAYGETAYLYYWPDTPDNREFVAKWNELARKQGEPNRLPPGLAAFGGYCAAKFLTSAILKAGSTDTEKVIDALEGLTIQTPRGPVKMRACDHQMITSNIWGAIVRVPGHPVPRLAAPYTVDPKTQEQLMGTCEEVLAKRRSRK